MLSAKRSRGTGVVAVSSTDRDEVRPVTALFADIVGSTALGEFLEIEEVRALVGQCSDRMAEVIEGHGGVIGSFMGDGIAAFFGLEFAREDDQVRAASAALDVRQVVAEYALEARAAWGVENLNVRIGINSGRVATGLVGGVEKQLQALGDAVNVGARLQSLADPGSIVIGPQVARAIAGEFEIRPIGPVAVKGRTKKVEAFVLVSAEPERASPRHERLVGRRNELARLEAIVDDLGAGRGQITFVLGEPGIGKSRLVEEVKERGGATVIWLEAHASSYRSALPYEAFIGALLSWLGLKHDEPDVAVRVRLQAKLSGLLGDAADELVPALSRLLGLRPRTKSDHALEGLPIDVRRRSLHDAFIRWLVALAQTHPVVLVIDNYERLDEASAGLAKELLAVTDVAPLLLVVCARQDEARDIRVHALTEFGHRFEELRLIPLPEADARSLVRSLDVHGAIGVDVAGALVLRAEGNPLYLHELFNAVVGAEGSDELVLPPALEGVLLARLDRLPRGAKELAQAAAVLGREFSRETLLHMRADENLDEDIRVLLRADVIRERRREPTAYTFKHGLLRDAALSTLTKRRLRDLHARAVHALEATAGAEIRDSVAAVAAHALASGDERKAVGLLEQLGERYASVYRLEDAIATIESCLKLVGASTGRARAGLLRRLAQLRGDAGDVQGAVQALEEVDEARLSADERAEIHVLKGELLANAGAVADAASVLSRCVTAGVGASQQRARALLAALHLRTQNLSEAKRLVDMLDSPDSLPQDVGLQVASVWAGYFAASGDFVSARTWGTKAVALASSLGRTSAELRAGRQLGVIQVLNGRLSDGSKLLRGTFDRSRDLGYTVGMLESGVNLVNVAYLMGDLDLAEETSRSILELTDAPIFEAHVKVNLSNVLFERDDLRNAEAIARRVLSLGIDATSPAPQIAAHCVTAKIRASLGDWSAAEEALQNAMHIAEQVDGRGGLVGAVRTELAELALLRDDADRALAEAEAGLDGMAFVEKPLHVPLLRVRGAAIASADKDAGRALLDDVRNMSRVMEMRLEEGRTLVAIGRAAPPPGEQWFTEAIEIFAACGSKRGQVEASRARSELIRS